MPIPRDLTRDQVLEAMRRIRIGGVPADARSTRFDVIHPETDAALPPKLVLSIAAELANGRPLYRRDFSGGEATNAVLRQLGFDVVYKGGAAAAPLTADQVRPGDVLTNDQLSAAFRVGNAGGARWSTERGHPVIIADHTKSLYDDRWDGPILHFTGMGQRGDQKLAGQNLRLARQAETGAPAHLFEVFTANQYRYVGCVELTDVIRRGIRTPFSG